MIYIRRGDPLELSVSVYVDGVLDALTTGVTVTAALHTQTGAAVQTLAASCAGGVVTIDSGNGTSSWPLGAFFVVATWTDTDGAPRSLYPPLAVTVLDGDEVHVVEVTSATGHAYGRDGSVSIQQVTAAASSGGGGGGTTQTLLYEMAASTAALGAPVFIRDDADLPATAGAAPTVTVVDIKAAPELAAKALRLEGLLLEGGWVFPLVGLPSLPAAGYVVEVRFSDIDPLGVGGFLMPLCRFVTGPPATVEGITSQLFSALNNMAGECQIVSTDYARVLGMVVSSTSWSTPPNTSFVDRGEYIQRTTIRRTSGTTPASWIMDVESYSPPGGGTLQASYASTAVPIAAFDAATWAGIGLGIWCPAGYGGFYDVSINVSSVRVFSLP